MRSISVVIVEDDAFTAQLLVSELEARGMRVRHASTAASALRLISLEQPHVLMSDLDLGQPVSGVDLLVRVSEDWPWVGLVALTSHADPTTVSTTGLPSDVVYLVKSEIGNLDELAQAVNDSVEGRAHPPKPVSPSPTLFATAEQSEVLQLMGQGLTNEEIASRTGMPLRTVERNVQRIFAMLGLERQSGRNRRVEAAQMWEAWKLTMQ